MDPLTLRRRRTLKEEKKLKKPKTAGLGEYKEREREFLTGVVREPSKLIVPNDTLWVVPIWMFKDF